MTSPTPTGPQVAAALSHAYSGQDWIAALGRGTLLPRAEVEQYLVTDAPVPPALLQAYQDIEQHLHLGTPTAKDDVFNATTNDADAPMEVDAEAGMTVSPGAKMAPSQTGSPHEMGEKPGALDPDQV
jgi:hypothetical protein